MKLNKVRLGDYLELVTLTNEDLIYSFGDVCGVNNRKELMPTKANINSRDLSKFQIINPDTFVFNHRTSRNGSKFSIAINDSKNTFICTEDYVLFRVKKDCLSLINPRWLYMFFNRSEFDRYVITNSWGSSTEFFNWDDLCNISLDLPTIESQRLYSSLYEALLNNKRCYKSKLDDLELVYQGIIEKERKTIGQMAIKPFIFDTSRKNDGSVTTIAGISKMHSFVSSDSRTNGVDKKKYLVVGPNEFAYSPIHINDGSIAYNDTNNHFLVSPIYKTFAITNMNTLRPKYLMLWFSRKEFTRYCWFYAFGSARDSFSWEQMCSFSIPIPDVAEQDNIIQIYDSIQQRKNILNSLDLSLVNACPILVKGSITEPGGHNGNV